MPNPDIINQAIEQVKKRAANYQYFFDNLKSSEWLIPLYNEGFFRIPPEPLFDKDSKGVSYPFWPESRYLSRIASKSPKQVLDIILKMENTRNIRVHHDLIDSALFMPPDISAQMIDKVVSWIDAPSVRWYPEGYGKLVGYLARGNQIEAALKLTRSLFELSIVEEAKKVVINKTTIIHEPKPESKFDDFWYKEILEKVEPILAEKAGMESLTLFCGILGNAVKLTERKIDEAPEELYYYSGPPAIEDHEQNNYHDDPIDILIFTLRKIAEELIEKYGIEVLKEIENHEFTIFKRIGFHLRWKWHDVDLIGTRKILSDVETFINKDLYHERYHLLQICFGELKPDEQDVYLKYIDKGIDKEPYKRFYNIQEIEKEERYWKYKQFYSIQEYIDNRPELWKKTFQELNSEFGEIKNPDFLRYIESGVWSGYRVPKSREQLTKMSIDELIAFLKDIEVSDDTYDDVIEGTGVILKELTLANPNKFAAESEHFKELQPPLVSGLLDGIQQAIKNSSGFDTQFWKPVLNLCKWVVDQPRDVHLRKGRYGKLDPNWGWTRQTIASLLEEGFKTEISYIPYEYRELAWNVLYPLTEDPDPTVERESGETTSFDPATLAINSIRGIAMHAVLYYALWINKHPNGESELSRGLDSMPEVKKVLEKHLNPDKDFSLAIRSFYGVMFPWLVQIDEEWVTQHIYKFFPHEQAYSKFRDTAWESFIMFTKPDPKIFKLMKEEYAYRVECIEKWSEEKTRFAHPDERLAIHLMWFYWDSEIELDEPKEFLPRFYEKASDTICGHTIKFIGNNLKYANGNILPRLMDLWNKRITHAESAKYEGFEKELTSFGNWFVPPVKFDDRWMIEQLKKVLKLYKKVEMDHIVIKWLSTKSEEYPSETVCCLTLMIEGNKEGWNIHRWKDDMMKILSTAIKNADANAHDSAIILVHRLGSLGNLEFRDLLKNQQKDENVDYC
ncbi:MAG: hypothetical protein WCU00_05975 [Candidatus Latescibacterota bacterium]